VAKAAEEDSKNSTFTVVILFFF